MAEGGGFIFGGNTGETQGSTSESRRRLSEVLMREGMSYEPVRHWTQGAARVAQGLMGAWDEKDADRKAEAQRQLLASTVAGGTAPAPRADTLTGGAGEAATGPAASEGTSTGGGGSAPASFGEVAPRLTADLQRDFGLNAQQAAGVVGNLGHESAGFSTLQEQAPVVPGSRGGFGYAQWTGPRRVAFEQWANQNRMDPRSYEANYGFLQHELRNTGEGSVLANLRAAPDARTATQVFSDQFLRPGVPAMQNRFRWTERALGLSPQRTAGNSAAAQQSVDQMWQNRPQFDYSRAPSQAPGPQAAAPAEDALMGGDGSDTAPQQMPAGDALERNPQITAPIDGVDAAWAERQRLAAIEDAKQRGLPWISTATGGRAGMGAGASATGGVAPGNLSASGVPDTPPIPLARPAGAPLPSNFNASGVPENPPTPSTRPDGLPPGATPAGPAQLPRQDLARALGIDERTRLMLLRDEGSLAPGEADRLRGQPPAEMRAPTQTAAAAPGASPAQGLAGGVSRLQQLIAGPAAALLGRRPGPDSAGGATPSAAPASATSAAGGAAPAQNSRAAALLGIATSPDADPQTRAIAMQQLQQMQPDVQIMMGQDGAIVAVDKRTQQARVIREAALPARPRKIITDGAGNYVYSVDEVTGQAYDTQGRPITPPQQGGDQAPAAPAPTGAPASPQPAPAGGSTAAPPPGTPAQGGAAPPSAQPPRTSVPSVPPATNAAPARPPAPTAGSNGLPLIQGARPMTPAERARWNVDPGDSRVWMMGPDGKPATVGGDQRGETAHQQVVGKALGEQQVALVNGEQTALSTISNLNAMERLVNDPRFYSGPGVELRNQVTKLMEGFGIASPGASSPNAVFEGLSRQDILQKIGGSLGPGVSNADLAYIQGIGANTGDAQQSIRDKIGAFRKLAERQAEIGRMAREYAAANNGKIDATFLGQLAQFARDNPVFPQPEAATPAGQRQGQATAPINPQAIDMLKANPTPTARQQFDAVFGAGAAARALGGQ